MDIQKLTKLPISVIEIAGKTTQSIIVITPHKGNVAIELKDTHYPFLFGSVTQTDKSIEEIIGKIRDLEIESFHFFIDKWLKSD